jgi:hypothetical protein
MKNRYLDKCKNKQFYNNCQKIRTEAPAFKDIGVGGTIFWNEKNETVPMSIINKILKIIYGISIERMVTNTKFSNYENRI